MVTGRRRIGKMTLIEEAFKDEPFVYFFVARKAESHLCEAYLEEIDEKLGIPLPPALPTELHGLNVLAGKEGFEPSTYGLTVRCSTC